ncbi:DsbA family protein [Caldimonas sp. KR1-144]|uniref:DsbA family protein n=1 Tax=Caldimonas sp. KR1-144 TaxID=3400911 RepID=UPI003BFC1819
MSPKVWISRRMSRLLTSPRLREARRRRAAWWRRLRGAEREVHYFHQADDPYSHLAAQLLPALAARHGVRVSAHLVPPPIEAAAPDRARLADWSRRDAARLADALGLDAQGFDRAPSPQAVTHAQHALLRSIDAGRFVEQAAAIGQALWRGAEGTAHADTGAALASHLAASARLRERLGHYLGATFHFEGEWYWGPDRLHHLERRLGAADGLIAAPPPLRWHLPQPGGAAPVLHFYCSLRSPYTYLACERVRRLAEHYGAELRLRFVLPMVMRGLPVPRAKRLYIVRDTKREAERLGIDFGCIVDPVGAPTERGLAVLHRAIALGRGPQFLESFLRGVFADGIDAGSARGLEAIAARAGIAADEVERALADDSWRAIAQANRDEMLALGLWGVPSFRVDERPALWGQDRLWMLERDLSRA